MRNTFYKGLWRPDLNGKEGDTRVLRNNGGDENVSILLDKCIEKKKTRHPRVFDSWNKSTVD